MELRYGLGASIETRVNTLMSELMSHVWYDEYKGGIKSFLSDLNAKCSRLEMTDADGL